MHAAPPSTPCPPLSTPCPPPPTAQARWDAQGWAGQGRDDVTAIVVFLPLNLPPLSVPPLNVPPLNVPAVESVGLPPGPHASASGVATPYEYKR